MKLLTLAIKQLKYRPTDVLTSFLLLSTSLVVLWLSSELKRQSEERVAANLAQTDLVVGAKGSPLQLVLSAIYHIDAPTGNIKLKDYQNLKRNPMIAQALPLAYGDNYKGFKIVGSNQDFLQWYQLKIKSGEYKNQPMEVALGFEVAQKTGLQIGDQFSGSHGLINQKEEVHAHGLYTVTAIFEQKHNVVDQLILTPIESVWAVHQHEEQHKHPEQDHASEPHEHEHGEIHDHDHGDHHDHDHHHDHGQNIDQHEQEITAILIRYRSKMAALQLPKMINEQPMLQAAAPAIELNRLYFFIQTGANALKLAGYALLLLALLSSWLYLSKSIFDRKEELILLRYLGFSKIKLVKLLLLEQWLWLLPAWLTSLIVARLVLWLIAGAQDWGAAYQYQIEAMLQIDWQLLVLVVFISLLSLIGPIYKVFKLQLASLLK